MFIQLYYRNGERTDILSSCIIIVLYITISFKCVWVDERDCVERNRMNEFIYTLRNVGKI